MSDPQQYKSYLSPSELKYDKDVEIKEEPIETADEFLIPEEYSEFFEATDEDQDKHVNDGSEASEMQNEQCAEMEMTFYECEVCKEGFTSNLEAKWHKKNDHVFDKPFHCEDSVISFTKEKQSEKHITTHEEAGPQLSKVQHWDKCRECKAKFKRHETADAPKFESFLCQNCKSSFAQQEYEEKNKRTCAEASLQLSKMQSKQSVDIEDKVECETCKMKFTFRWQSKKDKVLLVSDMPSLCPYCRIRSKRKNLADKNKRTHEEAGLKLSNIQNAKRAKTEETVVSEMCNVKFTFNSQTERQETGLASDKSTLCQSCRVSLKRKEWLEKSKVSLEEATVECVICKAKFKSNLRTYKQKVGQASGKSSVCHGCRIRMKMTEYLVKNRKAHKKASLELSTIQNEKTAEIRKTDECVICEIKFKSSCEAKRHEDIHSFDKPFHCHSCNVSFKERHPLKNHMKIHKLVSQYRCENCSSQFTDCNEEERDRAFRNYRIETCLYCGNTLKASRNDSWERKLNANLQLPNAQIKELANTGELYDCWICQVKFKSDWEAKMHKSFHSAENPYCCHSCCISFGDKRYDLHRHMQSHKVASQYRCKDCSLQFTDFNDKDRDRAFRNYRIKICLYCGNRLKIFEENGSDSQSSNVNDGESKTVSLPKQYRQLSKQVRVRTLPIGNMSSGKGRTECIKDNVTNADTVHQLPSGELVDMQKLHGEPNQTKEGNVEIVENNSDSFEIMERREQAQNENKIEINEIYKCEICYVTFGSILEAQNHENIHTFKKPYYCYSCDSKFKAKYKLKKHMENHKLVSQYRCNGCSFQFPDSNDRDRHKTLRDYRIKMCLYCGKKFPGIEKKASDVSSLLSSVHQELLDQDLSKLVPVRTLPLNDMDGMGVVEYRVVMARSNTIHPLSSHESEDLQKLRGDPKQTDTDDCAIDENNSQDFVILSGERLAQNGNYTGSNELYKCDICYVTFESILKAKRHENDHTFKEPFHCYCCKTTFKKKNGLVIHMGVHKIVSQYKCKECNFQFVNPKERDFKRALRNHRIKSCLYCGNPLPGILYNMNFLRESYPN